MLKEYAGEPLLPLQVSVLILILMEHAQRGDCMAEYNKTNETS